MKNDSKGIVVGIGVVICILLVLTLIGSFGPKCSMNGCDGDAKSGSQYCYLHYMSYRNYGTPDYNAVYESAQKRRENRTTSYSYGSSTQTNKSATEKKKTYSTYDSYDAGYEDVYENDDYNWDRYYSDDDYADGVDDAMDELDW